MTWFAHQVFAERRPDVIVPRRRAFGDLAAHSRGFDWSRYRLDP